MRVFNHRIDPAIEQFVFVRDVLVERHRLDLERRGEFAHGECQETVPVCELDGGAQNAVATQWRVERRACE